MLAWTNALRAHYRWIIVATGGVLGCVAIGGLFSLPVFLRPIAFNTQNQVTRQSVVIAASVEFKDKDGKVIWANPGFQATDEYEVTGSTNPTDAAALFRTDINALERLAKNFSRAMVIGIFEAF